MIYLNALVLIIYMINDHYEKNGYDIFFIFSLIVYIQFGNDRIHCLSLCGGETHLYQECELPCPTDWSELHNL